MAERDEYLKTGKRNSATDAERLQKIHDLATENGAQCKSEMDYPQRSLPDNALKAISQTDDELVVGNHIIVFGGRDLTGIAYAKNKDGSSGEYFTA